MKFNLNELMITIRNLQFSYGSHSVFQNVSLHLEAGRIYGMLGQNGVGKSTLLKLAAGLLKPEKGTCLVKGDIPFLRNPSFLESIYYLPEDFSGPDAVIGHYAERAGSFYSSYDAGKFRELSRAFDIDPKRRFTQLSLGQRKKAIIAFALALNTDILLMDEPSNGLDIPSKVLLRRMIAENATEKQTVVISTHQVRDLENLIDPILILDRDGILLNASVEEISRKLLFTIETQPDPEALYSEPSLNGYMTVRLNDDPDRETPVDLEVLFNCSLNNKTVVRELFRPNDSLNLSK